MLTSILLGIVAVAGTNGLTAWYKNALERYGATKIHVFVFALSLVFSVLYAIVMANETLLLIAKHVGIIFAASIATYEVVWKQFGKVLNVDTNVS